MKLSKIIKIVLACLAWLAIFASIFMLVFGFGESGMKIIGVTDFWTMVNSCWLLAILCFVIESRVKL